MPYLPDDTDLSSWPEDEPDPATWLSVRTVMALYANRIKTLGQLRAVKHLEQLSRIGPISRDEIVAFLRYWSGEAIRSPKNRQYECARRIAPLRVLRWKRGAA